jgi:hypothetical protein
MKMCPCKSSQVAEHGYDAATRTLAIRFKSGDLYHYADVPPAAYEALGKAKSIGSHLHQHVKGRYKHSRVK